MKRVNTSSVPATSGIEFPAVRFFTSGRLPIAAIFTRTSGISRVNLIVHSKKRDADIKPV